MTSITAEKEEGFDGFKAPSVESSIKTETIRDQWKKVWLLQQDVEQIKAGDFSCVPFWPFELFPVWRFALVPVELDMVAIAFPRVGAVVPWWHAVTRNRALPWRSAGAGVLRKHRVRAGFCAAVMPKLDRLRLFFGHRLHLRPIRSDVFTSLIDEASGLQSAFTVYYAFDKALFSAAMIVYAVNVAGRLVLGLRVLFKIPKGEEVVKGTAWRRALGLLLMLIEPVSGNRLLEGTREARTEVGSQQVGQRRLGRMC